MKILTCLVVAFAFTITGVSLGKTAIAPIEIVSPEEAVSSLRSSNVEQRQNIARLLNLSEPWRGGTLCSAYQKVELSQPKLQASNESALLTITASDCDFPFLVPLVEEQHHWSIAGTVPIWTKYSTPQYSIESLTTAHESEIVIHGQTVDSGTGIVQRNLTILRVVGKSIRVIFDQPEILHISVPIVVNGKSENALDEESSVFTFVNSAPFVPGLKTIIETRVLHIADRSITVKREYVWTPSLSIFRMYGAGPSGTK